MPNNTALLARLASAAARMAEENGFEYVDTELVKEPSGRFLRVYIDKQGGITLNELEQFHKRIRPLADDIDYDYMEVSSPGADRPLKKPRDFERAMGLTVEVRLYKPMDGAKQFIGTLTGFENGVIEIEDASGKRSFEQKSVAQIRPFVDVDKELDDSKDLL
ncbi:MAG: ribosome maturation factor RimP [Clostridia bacterium]|nr:ribosome maturation factor RimP [Clostridia bacterium]